MKTEILSPTDLSRAADILKKGELIAFPTETVYGLGGNIFIPEAIEKIYAVKGRPQDNPLIVHISHLDQVEELAVNIPDSFYRLAEIFFPGPLTLVLERHPNIPAQVSAGLSTIAIRMPAHPIARALLEELGAPIAAPSANLSGKPSSTQLQHVLDDFNGKIPAVIDGGQTELGLESTVLSLLDPERPVLLRPGAIHKEQIQMYLPADIVDFRTGDVAASPGLKYRHYAPQVPLKIFTDWTTLELYLKGSFSSKRMLLSRENPSVKTHSFSQYFLSGKDLYHCLRLADMDKYEEVLIYCCDEVLKDPALMNRLTRAASAQDLP